MSAWNRKLLALTAATAVACSATAAASSATTLAGRWVATAGGKKIVLTLHKAGAVYKGTYVASGKAYKAVARGGSADGAAQVMLTLTPGHQSTMCGLQGSKLFCSLPTGTATFKRA